MKWRRHWRLSLFHPGKRGHRDIAIAWPLSGQARACPGVAIFGGSGSPADGDGFPRQRQPRQARGQPAIRIAAGAKNERSCHALPRRACQPGHHRRVAAAPMCAAAQSRGASGPRGAICGAVSALGRGPGGSRRAPTTPAAQAAPGTGERHARRRTAHGRHGHTGRRPVPARDRTHSRAANGARQRLCLRTRPPVVALPKPRGPASRESDRSKCFRELVPWQITFALRNLRRVAAAGGLATRSEVDPVLDDVVTTH